MVAPWIILNRGFLDSSCAWENGSDKWHIGHEMSHKRTTIEFRADLLFHRNPFLIISYRRWPPQPGDGEKNSCIFQKYAAKKALNAVGKLTDILNIDREFQNMRGFTTNGARYSFESRVMVVYHEQSGKRFQIGREQVIGLWSKMDINE